MEIKKETASYNHRRYSRPWIAKVNFAANAKGDFSFGDWTGDQYNGGEGILSISAEAGDIIAWGQKDFRQPKNSAPDFGYVSADGKLIYIGDKGEAYKYYLANKASTPTTPDISALLAEKEKLIARLAEIDVVLAPEKK